MRYAVLDFQAFTGNEKVAFIVKELTVIDLHTLEEESFVFKPPRDLPLEEGRSNNDKWLVRNFHRLEWGKGDHDYSYLEFVLEKVSKKYKFVFAKGYEKCDFLESEMRHPVYDLQKFGCPSLKVLTRSIRRCQRCPNHQGVRFSVCAHIQARVLAEWASENRDKIDMTQDRVRVNTFSDWAANQDPARIARMGFVHVRGTKTGIRCVYCEYEVPRVPYTIQDLQKDHEDLNKDCPIFTQIQ